MLKTDTLEVSLTVPMFPGLEVVATAQAAALGEYIGMERDKIEEMKLAIIEACINAFEHSHGRDGQVHFTFRIHRENGQDALEVVVRDQGMGFDPESIETPVLEKKLHSSRKRGWGLKIIESLMDSVRIESNAEGTAISMRKNK
jgi:serine/threonine-protein kinase RsbW